MVRIKVAMATYVDLGNYFVQVMFLKAIGLHIWERYIYIAVNGVTQVQAKNVKIFQGWQFVNVQLYNKLGVFHTS